MELLCGLAATSGHWHDGPPEAIVELDAEESSRVVDGVSRMSRSVLNFE